MEEFENSELGEILAAIKAISEIDENALTDETMDLVTKQIEQSFSPAMIKQSVNQMIENFESQSMSKADAINAMDALTKVFNEMIYEGKEYHGNKKLIIDSIMNSLFDVIQQAVDKYHSYSIELPMIVDTAAGAKVPTYAHETDAAADLYAMEDTTLYGGTKGNKIRTGVKIQLPEGWLALIIPRSSIGAKTPLRLSNSVGLIDSGYRGELGVLYDNTSDEDYKISAGDRIAQLLVMPSHRFQAKVVDILADSDRGETGFGDSGK